MIIFLNSVCLLTPGEGGPKSLNYKTYCTLFHCLFDCRVMCVSQSEIRQLLGCKVLGAFSRFNCSVNFPKGNK